MPSRSYRIVVPGPVLLTLLLVAGALAPRPALAFNFSGTNYATGTTPWDVSLEDVSGDGKRDLVTSNYGAATISVRLGDGVGGFGAKVDYATGVNPVTLAIGDVDADGDKDIVVENWSSSSISVLLNTGAGAFAPRVDYVSGTRSIGGRLARIDADADLDLVLLNRNAGQLRVMPNSGAGVFASGTLYAAGSESYALAIGDLNGDTILDAVVGNDGAGTTVGVLLGDGAGGFGPATLVSVGTTPSGVALGLINGDGNLDLVVSNRGTSTISVLAGNGGGGFGPKTDYATPGVPLGVAIGDLDVDGDADIAVAVAGGLVSLFPGNGAGAFGARADFGTVGTPTMVAIADVDADGKNDFAVTTGTGNVVTVYLNTTPSVSVPSAGNSTCPAAAQVGPSGQCCFDIVVRDLANNPIPGATVAADFEGCPTSLCAVQPPGVQVAGVSAIVITNPAGVAHFCVCASALVAGCVVQVSAEGVPLCSIPVTTCGAQPADSCTVPGWNTLAIAGPPARTRAAMVRDEGRGSLVLFGGSTNSGAVGDLWEWDGLGWLGRSDLGPSARTDHAMAYDRLRDRVVLFGGLVGGVPDGQTWEWSGAGWTLVSTSGPSARSGHSLSYDEVTQQVILFGGFDGTDVLGDTWAWNGTTWTLLSTLGPMARMHAAMAGDPERERILLFGGTTSNSESYAVNDTWEWDGTTWTELVAPGPLARGRHAMTFGPPLSRIIMSGGTSMLGQALADTWSWDGYSWRQETGGIATSSAAMAYDYARGVVLAFGGDAGGLRDSLTSQYCCQCDDEGIETDSTGAVVFPPTFDPQETVTYHDIEQDMGDISVLYPDEHTSADTWLKDYPCATAIGGTLPPGALDPAWDDSLEALGIHATVQEISDSLETWEQQLLTMFGNEPDGLPNAPPVGNGPYVLPPQPWCPPDSGSYVFGGRDIVFVHGLQVDHVWKRMIFNSGALTDWVPPSGGQTGQQLNPEFYDTGGFYRDIAVENWEPHIEEFLRSRNIMNRYVIVTYPCNDRLEVGIQAILTQINDAMRYGINVENPGGTDKTRFGTPSFVVVSHSTGGLVVAAAMNAARTDANLNAGFIAERCKAHVALAPALSGSRLATAAIAVTGVIGGASATYVPWLCPLFNIATEIFSPDLPDCPIAANVALRSVLVDLVPAITKSKWGDAVNGAGVPTITISGAHPTKLGPLKWLNLGFDDAVLNVNSSTANPGTTFLWPSGFIAEGGPLGIRKTYDMGMQLRDGDDKRADGIFHDQTKDGGIFAATNYIPFYVASGPIPYVSPTGMLQSVGYEFDGNNGLNPLRRYDGYYSFMASAADHFSVRSAEFYPNYAPTKHLSFNTQNTEESRVIREVDEPALRAHYSPQPAYSYDDQPLLTAACTPAVHDVMIGREVRFGIRIFGRRFEKRFWVWKRHYMRPVGMAEKHVCDYVYGSILACEPPARSCTPIVGVGDLGELVASATSRPNPASGQVTFDFTLPTAGRVNLTIHDVSGRTVRRLVGRDYAPGVHRVVWDGFDQNGGRVAAGVYFWKIQSSGYETTRRLVVVR